MSGPLTPAGEAAVAELAQRYRVSDGAVRALLDAVIRGGGAMAQFSHPDLGGSGQWMRGGMTMVGDMFNSGLQSTVSGICSELSAKMAAGEALVTPAARSAAGGDFGSFGGDWWPSDLGRPSSSGGQNDASYAYFPGPRRLAIRRGSQITLYDTGAHAISGVQQQQGSRGTLEFSSQFGTFTVDSLAVVGGDDGDPDPRRPETAPPAVTPTHGAPTHGAPADGALIPSAQPYPSGQSQSQSQQSFARPAPPAPAPPTPAHPAPAPSTPAHPAAAPAAPEQHVAAAPPAAAPPPSPAAPPPTKPPDPAPSGVATSAAEIGAAIETLGGLRDKGFLTEEEFAAKKAEILARL
jgi:hypothetical protein